MKYHPPELRPVSLGRAPHGARGLKWPSSSTNCTPSQSRAPHGARGLKWLMAVCPERIRKSRPARGAWIEIAADTSAAGSDTSRPARGAWIEIRCHPPARCSRRSRPARGAWIEIVIIFLHGCDTEGRRAPHGARGLKCDNEALVHDQVGRAPHGARGLKYVLCPAAQIAVGSRPARGAWIEIVARQYRKMPHQVAPRTGRVD